MSPSYNAVKGNTWKGNDYHVKQLILHFFFTSGDQPVCDINTSWLPAESFLCFHNSFSGAPNACSDVPFCPSNHISKAAFPTNQLTCHAVCIGRSFSAFLSFLVFFSHCPLPSLCLPTLGSGQALQGGSGHGQWIWGAAASTASSSLWEEGGMR